MDLGLPRWQRQQQLQQAGGIGKLKRSLGGKQAHQRSRSVAGVSLISGFGPYNLPGMGLENLLFGPVCDTGEPPLKCSSYGGVLLWKITEWVIFQNPVVEYQVSHPFWVVC